MSTDHNRGRGFTLIEVVAALTILVLMAGTIFAIVSGATQAGAEIEALQKEDRRLEAFVRLFRETMATFPPGANLELQVIETSPLVQHLVIRGAPEAFAFGPEGRAGIAECRLGLRKVPEEVAREWRRRRPDAAEAGAVDAAALELYTLALSTPNFHVPAPEGTAIPVRSPIRRPDGTPWVKPDREGRFWLDLVPDLEELTWRFWDPGKKQWLDKSGATRPQIIELTMRPRGRSTPIRALFRPGA